MYLTRCGSCAGCIFKKYFGDCQECNYCKDMTKFGGNGKLRQSCVCCRCVYKKQNTTSRTLSQCKKCKPSCTKCEFRRLWHHKYIGNRPRIPITFIK